jgi:SAM-dependent methyltransferase
MNKPTLSKVMELTSTVSSPTAFSDTECAKLYELCCEMQSLSTVVEIGCQLGRTSSIIAQVGKAVGYHSVHIDPYTSQYEYLGPWVKMMHEVGNPFTFHCMRTDQARRWLDAIDIIDLLLIDGDHTEDGVKKDCAVAAELVRVGGYLAAHDFTQQSWPEVERVLSAYAVAPKWKAVGVYGTLGVWQRCHA